MGGAVCVRRVSDNEMQGKDTQLNNDAAFFIYFIF